MAVCAAIVFLEHRVWRKDTAGLEAGGFDGGCVRGAADHVADRGGELVRFVPLVPE